MQLELSRNLSKDAVVGGWTRAAVTCLADGV